MKNWDIPRPAKSFICGATAGALASFIVNPFDVAKTQQQVRSGKALPSFGILYRLPNPSVTKSEGKDV